MQYGLIALILVQLIIAAACAMVYLRQRSLGDVDKHERAELKARVELTYGLADSAKKSVEMIEVSHYKALAAKYEVALQEIAALKAQVRSLEESQQALSNKLASRERMDRAALKKERDEAAQVPEAPLTLEDLKRNGVAIPLQGEPAPATTPTSKFGRQMRR